MVPKEKLPNFRVFREWRTPLRKKLYHLGNYILWLGIYGLGNPKRTTERKLTDKQTKEINPVAVLSDLIQGQWFRFQRPPKLKMLFLVKLFSVEHFFIPKDTTRI